MPSDLEAIADSMFAAMEAYLAKAVAPLIARCAELEAQVKALPVPKEGEFATIADAAPLLREMVTALPPAPAGKDADPAAIAAEVARQIALIPLPKDAEPIHPDTVRLLVAEEVTKAVAAIPKARDGEPGRDAAQIDVLPALDEAKAYPRGVFASHRGAFVRSSRTTEPLTGKTLSDAGWQILVDGDRDTDIEQADDLRTFIFRKVKASGVVIERKATLPVIIDRGVFHNGDDYTHGDACTWDGSLWIAQRGTKEKPGINGDWRLAVKRGRDGKDFHRAA